MWRLKQCQRCLGGDLYREGWEEEWTCLQCGGRVHQNGSRAERRAGELLAEIQREPGQRGEEPTSLQAAIRSVGIEDTMAHRWQAEARVPAGWQALQDAVDALG
jgi:hypothetical protein